VQLSVLPKTMMARDMERTIAVGIIGMGVMGRMYATRFSQAGWK